MSKVNREEDLREEFEGVFYKNTGVIRLNDQQLRDDVWKWFEDRTSQTRNDLLRELMEEMPKKSPFISQLCQNRNLNDYCGTCEQAWEDCSCPARNTGFNDCHDQVNTILESKLSTVKKI